MHCPHCGARHQEDGFKCTECGQMIHVVPKTTWRSIVIGAIVLVILGIAAFAFIYMDSNKVGLFAEEQPQSFNDYSWEELADISSNMTFAGNVDGAMREAKKHGFVADDGSLRTDLVKDITLADGTVVQAHLVGVYHDPRTNNSGNAGMSFIITAPISESSMNDTATNSGGWDASAVRKEVNENFFSSLPEDLQKYIVKVRKQTNNTGQTGSADAVTVSEDKIWALSVVELTGTLEGDEGYAEVLNAEGSQYALLSNAGLREDIEKKIASSSSLNWWLRSPNPETQTQFFSQGTGYDTGQATPLSIDANSKLSVVVGFCI